MAPSGPARAPAGHGSPAADRTLPVMLTDPRFADRWHITAQILPEMPLSDLHGAHVFRTPAAGNLHDPAVLPESFHCAH